MSVVSTPRFSVTRMVRSRVDPPAPYVTETKLGSSGSSSRIACQRSRSPSSVAGGKNSNDHDFWPSASRSRMVVAPPGIVDARPRDMAPG